MATNNYKISNTNTGKFAAPPTTNKGINLIEFSESILLKIIAITVWPWMQVSEIIGSFMYVLFAPLRIWKLIFQTTMATLVVFVHSIEGLRNGKGLNEFIKNLPETSWIRSFIKQLKEILDDILGYRPIENGDVSQPIENSKSE